MGDYDFEYHSGWEKRDTARSNVHLSSQEIQSGRERQAWE